VSSIITALIGLTTQNKLFTARILRIMYRLLYSAVKFSDCSSQTKV